MQVLVTLEQLERVSTFQEFVQIFSQFGNEMVEFAHLTGDRQNVSDLSLSLSHTHTHTHTHTPRCSPSIVPSLHFTDNHTLIRTLPMAYVYSLCRFIHRMRGEREDNGGILVIRTDLCCTLQFQSAALKPH